MSRYYFSYEEDEAYREGKRDEEYGRGDFNHNSYAFDGPDRAYFDGREDMKREERQEEERREEHEMEERREEQHAYERMQQYQEEEQREYESMQERQQEEQHESCKDNRSYEEKVKSWDDGGMMNHDDD